MRTLLLMILLAVVPALGAQSRAPEGAQAPVASAELTEAETERLKHLAAELRCLVCQNQSLADSHAELAIDLRNQVRDQIRAGRDDEQIKDYLVQRYGDFVLYRPRLSAMTMLLWSGPFVLLLLGGWAMWRYLRRRQRLPDGATADRAEGHVMADADADAAVASDDRLARARALLHDEGAADAPERRP